MNFLAEDGCDRFIYENLGIPTKGFYLDCGAAHPDKYSQTAFLRDLGWNGIAIDGNPAYAPEWENVEGSVFIPAVLSSVPEVNFLIEPTNALVSRQHETGTPVLTKRLDDLLIKHEIPKVDFLSLDLEGMEYSAIKTLDLTRFRIPIIVSEYRSGHFGEDFRVLHHLVHWGYEVVHATNSNLVFRRP